AGRRGGSGSRRRRTGRLSAEGSRCGRLRPLPRQPQPEASPPTRRGDEIQRAAVIVRDLPAEMKPQAGPVPNLAGREERVEDALRQLGWDPRTAVRDSYFDAFALGSRRDPDAPALARRPHGVVEQVQEDLVQGGGAADDLATESKVALEADLLAARAQEADRRLDPLMWIPGLRAAVRPPHVQEIAHQARDLLAGLDRDADRFDEVGIGAAGGELALHRPE